MSDCWLRSAPASSSITCHARGRECLPQLWTPYAFTAEDKTNRVAWGWTVFARLKQGASLEQAQTEMDLIAAQMEQTYPEHYQNIRASFVCNARIRALSRADC